MGNVKSSGIKSLLGNNTDRVFINELLKAEAVGPSSDTQGGYYNPDGLTDADLTAVGYGSAADASFDVKNDLLNVVKQMRKRKDVAPV